MPGQQGLRASVLSLSLEKEGLFLLWNTVEDRVSAPVCNNYNFELSCLDKISKEASC